MKLEDELNKPQLSEAQLKEQLMAQVKKDKEDTAWYQQKITEHEQNRTAWVRQTMALPPRQAGDRWEPVTDCSPN